MKKFFSIFFSTMLLILLGACEDKKNTPVDNTLSLTPNDPIQFDATGGVKTITVTTNMSTWDVTSSQTWCVVVKATDGKSFTVSATNYVDKASQPPATVTITAKNGIDTKSVTLSVNQSGVEAEPFAITLADADAQSVKMSIVPTDKTARYYFGVISNKDLQTNHANDLAAYITSVVKLALEQNGGNIETALAAICTVGDHTSPIDKLTSITDYTAFAVGLGNDGKASTRIVKQEFKTLDVTILFTATKITARNATVSILPTLSNAGYLCDLMDQATYDQYANDMKGFVENYVTEIGEDYQSMLRQGKDDLSFNRRLSPNTKYYAWAAYMDENKKVKGEIVAIELFTTLVDQPNPAVTVTSSVGKYFNGTDLYNTDPVKYKAAKGKVIVPTTFTPTSEQTVGWCVSMLASGFPGMTIFDMMSEEDVLFMVLDGARWDTQTADFYCPWGTVSACAIGVDANDNLGTFYHHDYEFTKEGASPISEYVPVESKSPAHAQQIQPGKALKAGAKTSVYRYVSQKNRF